MQSILDIRTTFVVVSMIGLVLFLCMVYVARTRKTYPGFIFWTISSLLYLVANFLIAFRGVLPDYLTIIAANGIASVSIWIIPYGMVVFANKHHPVWPYILAAFFPILWVAYFTYGHPDTNARIVTMSIIFAVATGYSSILFKRIIPPFLKSSNLLLMFGFGISAVWSLTRIVLTLYFEPQTASFFSTSSLQSASIIIYCGLYFFIFFGLLTLNSQRVEYDLGKATEAVKTLEGILPICAHCKKIRDDKGYWNQVETYIQHHSEATFTHSICTECLDRLYPE